MKQVITHNVFQCPAAKADNFTVRQYHFNTQDILLCYAIFDTRGTTGILGNNAAEGCTQETLGVRWKEKTILRESERQVLKDNPGLHGSGKVLFVHFQYLVHLRRAENNSSVPGNRSTAHVCAPASGSYRDFLGIGNLHNLRNCLRGGGEYHYLGLMYPVCGSVIGICLQRLRCREDILFTGNPLKFTYQ